MTSASSPSAPLYGYIAFTQDALLLFEACLRGTLVVSCRRSRERVNLIKTGNVFIYTEQVSGINRWTAGLL